MIEKPICKYCQSDDVSVEASAKWNINAQKWELVATFSSCFCHSCEETSSHLN